MVSVVSYYLPMLILLLAILLSLLLSTCSEEWVRPSTPNYSDLESKSPSAMHKDPNFINACAEMAGYYKDPARNPTLKNTIMLVGVNNGYKDFFHNFKCYMDRLGIKFLPVSLDEGVYGYLTNNKISTTYLLGDIPGRDKVASEPSGFGGKNFNLIGCRKMEAVGAALKLGYNVIFSDVDIAVLKDPIDFLFLDGFDYTHSTNNGCAKKWSFNDTMEGNTGFYAVRSNPNTIRTWDLTYRLCARSPKYDDQTIFWLILRTNTNPRARPVKSCPKPESYFRQKLLDGNGVAQKQIAPPAETNVVTNCPLDDCMFSAGNIRDYTQQMLLAQILKQRKDYPVIIHANWLSGKDNKKNAMLRAGLWIARRVGPAPQGTQTTSLNKAKVKPIGGNWTCLEPTGPFRAL